MPDTSRVAHEAALEFLDSELHAEVAERVRLFHTYADEVRADIENAGKSPRRSAKWREAQGEAKGADSIYMALIRAWLRNSRWSYYTADPGFINRVTLAIMRIVRGEAPASN